MNALIGLLSNNTNQCQLARLIKGLIQLETKLECNVLSHEEYVEELSVLYFMEESRKNSPLEKIAINEAFNLIINLAKHKFLDMEPR